MDGRELHQAMAATHCEKWLNNGKGIYELENVDGCDGVELGEIEFIECV